MAAERVLVVDDDKLSVELVTALLEKAACRVSAAYNGEQGWECFRSESADLVLMDVRMPRMSGMELLKKIKSASPETPVVVMTAYASIDAAVEAMRLGASDFLAKPFRQEQIEEIIQRLRDMADVDRPRTSLTRSRPEERIVTDDPRMLSICETVQRAAATKASVLIQGESGTGKELFARFLHLHSPRAARPFIAVNCASLPETLLESELFGHEKGAFTGALSRRAGRFELANGGTLLLDEISEISPSIQAKLLRVLEEEEFERVGGTTTLRVDVRIVATTNRNLRDAIASGAFREDLYYRLNVIPIVLPPLRERRADIPALVAHFLRLYAEQCDRPVPQISPEAMEHLTRYDWPGNVRELRNLIQRLVVLHDSDRIDVRDLPPEIRVGPRLAGTGVRVGQTIEEAERWLILKTLEQTGGSRAEAASMLGITTRTLRNKLARYRRELAGSDAERFSLRAEKFSAAEEFVPSPHGDARKISGGTSFASALA